MDPARQRKDYREKKEKRIDPHSSIDVLINPYPPKSAVAIQSTTSPSASVDASFSPQYYSDP
jgi:hypothetical protein